MTLPTLPSELGAVARTIADRRVEIADARKLPRDLVDDLKHAGAFRIAVPKASGGPELSPRAQNEIIEALSYEDASVGWCVMIGSDAPFYGAFMDPSAAANLWTSIDDITAGMLQPAGRARREGDGYVVSGQWPFGSGSTHAEVLVGGCLVVDDSGSPIMTDRGPDWIIPAARADQWTILDTWHTTGLAGSGSNDYTAVDLFVNAEHCFRLSDPVQRAEPLYQFPGSFFANMSGVALGLTRRSIDMVHEIAQDKLVMPEFVMMRDLPRVRLEVARARAQFGAARTYAYGALDAMWEELERGDQLSVSTRVDIALSRAHAFDVARTVTRALADVVGASTIYRNHPLEQLQRDAGTLRQHIVAQDRTMEMIGGLALTGSSELPFF